MRSKRCYLFVLIMAALACLELGLETVRAGDGEQEIVSLIIDELKSGEPERQTGAIAVARDMPGPALTQALAAELPTLSPPIQVQLLSALADRGDASALPAVIAAVGSADESVRMAALRAVGQLGDASNVLFLAQRAAESRGPEQAAARESLYRLRGAGTDATVLNEIPAAATDVQIELIRAVGQRNITRSVETLLAVAQGDDRRVRVESIRMLGVVAGPDDLPALVNLLLQLTDPSDRTAAERTITAVAHKVRDETAGVPVVLEVLAGVEDASGRASLLRVLGRIGNDAGLPVLRQSLDSPDSEVRDAAIRALADWPTSDPADDLLRIAQTAEVPVHRTLALRGFVRMLGLRRDLSAQQSADLYRKALDLAPNVVEKRRVLSALAGEDSLAALEVAAEYLTDPTLHPEAELAVVQIIRNGGDKYPQRALDLLEHVVENTANETLRGQAQELIDEIKGAGSVG